MRTNLNRLLYILTLLFFSPGTALALPSGQQVVNGNATFSTQGNSLTITNTPNTIINWQNFSILGNESVLFSRAKQQQFSIKPHNRTKPFLHPGPAAVQRQGISRQSKRRILRTGLTGQCKRTYCIHTGHKRQGFPRRQLQFYRGGYSRSNTEPGNIQQRQAAELCI